jgi:hypothetical protein
MTMHSVQVYSWWRRRRPIAQALVALALIWLGMLLPADGVYAADPAFQKGMSYAAWWSGAYRAPGAELSLQALKSTGAGWIALIVTGHQDGISATTIDRTHISTPTDADLIHAINQAHSLGLKVMLKPHLDLFNEVPGGQWRGDIGKAFTGEAQWAAWFSAYRGFINHYAALAQAHGVEQFCIGTELLGTSHRADDWRTVAAGVRAIYHGPIVYAALKDGEEVAITWWDAVDYIGIDGYYRLNTDIGIHPTVAQLEAAWATPRQIMAGLSARYNRPILLTEIGYRSYHGCTMQPWDSWVVSDVDLEEQANAYEAAFRQLYHQPWLHGIFWWTWLPDRFESGPCETGFTPYLKPAESVLRNWYGGQPVAAAEVLFPDYDIRLDIYRDDLASGWQDWSWGASPLELAAASPVQEGSHAIAATLGAWGALSLWHSPLSHDDYHWLEFQVRSAAGNPRIMVYVSTEDGSEQDHVPVNYCGHIAGGKIEPGAWKTVRIPLQDLNRSGQRITRLNFQNASGQPATLYVDAIRLVGAQTPSHRISLPVVTRAQ